MSVLRKKFKYTIDYAGKSHVVAVDPQSWEDQTLGIERSDDFGLNVQNGVPLLFTGGVADILRKLYSDNSVFSQSVLRIDKLQNNWKYAPFYSGKQDYTTYRDKMYGVEMSGIETGLAAKFADYKDIEYEIEVPAAGTHLSYTGVSVVKANQIQAGYGELNEVSAFNEDAYVLKGKRAVRNYSDILSFTDTTGTPYETMTFRILGHTGMVTFNLDVKMLLTVAAQVTIFDTQPSPGSIKIVLHTPGTNSIIQTLKTIDPSETRYLTVPLTGAVIYDTFSHEEIISVSVTNANDVNLSVYYQADSTKGYTKVLVNEAAGCYIETSDLVVSPYTASQLRVFTHEWLIGQLLSKIDPANILLSEIDYGTGPVELLSATQCIKKLGNVTSTVTIKAKLVDVLESLNKLRCIGVDILGNTMVLKNRQTFYPEEAYGEIKCTDIELAHDIEHQYNSVEVGSDAETTHEIGKIYPFIGKKVFSVADSPLSAKLDLVHPFMCDPYTIEAYINDTLSDTSTDDETKFMVLSCEQAGFSEYSIGTATNVQIPASNTGVWKYLTGWSGTPYAADLPIEIPWSVDLAIASYPNQLFLWEPAEPRNYIVNITVDISTTVPTEFKASWFLDNLAGEKPLDIKFLSENRVLITSEFGGRFQTSNIIRSEIGLKWDGDNTVTINSLTIDIREYANGEATLYKDHTLTNFQGDAPTVFNVPLSPKRILQRHAPYLAISTYGKTDKTLEFTSSDVSNNLGSQLATEASAITENANMDLTGEDPMFLPVKISANTKEDLIDVDTFMDKRYKYVTVTDKKSKKTFTGWINSITFAVAKNKEKQIEMQSRSV